MYFIQYSKSFIAIILVFLLNFSNFLLNPTLALADEPLTLISKWGADLTLDGHFRWPMDVAIDSDGNIYVEDTLYPDYNYIHKFDSDGNFLTKWEGQLNERQGVAVDNDGNTYRIVDSVVNGIRVQKFNSSGTLLVEWGNEGSGEGEFSHASDLAVDSMNNVYVSDSGNHRIQKFNSNGVYLAQWGSFGSGNGQFDHPSGLAIDSADNIYIADTVNYRVQKFDSQGKFLNKIGADLTLPGHFKFPADVAIDSIGNVYVADSDNNNRIQKLDSQGNPITQWGHFGNGNGEFYLPQDIILDSADNIYVADTYNHRVQKFDSQGTYLTQWGNEGTGEGEFSFPEGIAVDQVNNIYVVDKGNNRIQKFDSDGVYLMSWAINNLSMDIVIDSASNIYVVSHNHVKKFDSYGTLLTQWGSEGSGNGEFKSPEGIAIDNKDNIYIADTSNRRIQKFDSQGIYLAQWGSNSSGNDQFTDPKGIAIDDAGYIYVADNHYIKKFSMIVNQRPQFKSTPIVTVTQSITYQYHITATDSNSDTLTITAPNTPAWLTLTDYGNGTAILTGTPELTGTYLVSLLLQDSAGLTNTQLFSITVNPLPNKKPQFNSTPIVTVTQSMTYQYHITTTDPDNDTLTITAPNTPAWLTLTDYGNGTAILTGTPELTGTYSVSLLAQDAAGLTNTQLFSITVNPLPNKKPQFNSTPTVTVTQSMTYQYHITTTDPDNDTVTITAPNTPAWLTLTDYGNGTAILTGTPELTGTYSVSLLVQDAAGLTNTQLFSLTVLALDSPAFPPNTPTDPVLIAPREIITATDTPTVFQWKAITNPARLAYYTLQLNSQAQLSSLATTTITTTQTIYTTTHPLSSGVYSWTVTAHDTLGQTSPVLEPVHFIIPMLHNIYLPIVVKTVPNK